VAEEDERRAETLASDDGEPTRFVEPALSMPGPDRESSGPGGMGDRTAARWGGRDSIPARESGAHAAGVNETEPSRPDDPSQMLVDRDLHFERQDHAASVARMRRLLPIAIVLWLGFFVVDFVLATWVVPGDLLSYLALRLAGTVPIAGAYAVLRLAPAPSPRMLQVLDIVMTSSCAAILTGMCLLSGGLLSPYNSYIPLVLVGRAAVLPNRWQDGAVRLGVPALMNPLILGGAALASSSVAAQWADPGARGTWFFYLMLINGAWLLLVIGGHNVWALRRQVYASRSIGRYRLEKRIGRGGMGEVWVAWHEQLRRKVALKILRPEAGTDPHTIARFEREVMATAELTHPNTVRIYDHGVTEDGLWYYAMELLSGEDLGTLVRAEGPLPPARALHIVRQLARAMAEAHAHGIIHRDIKPENIFITTLGGEVDFVKVLDFGIAKLDRPDGSGNLTTTGFVAGTPAYVAPEVTTGGSADARTDVYGIGGTLYYALTGTIPFRADNPRELFHKHLREPLELPSARLGEPMPADLEAVVVRAMAKQPDHRFAHAGELVDALDACEGGAWGAVPTAASEASGRQRTARYGD
jgi:serine/threonine-protein kinase